MTISKKETKVFNNPEEFQAFLSTLKKLPNKFNRPIKKLHVGKMTESVKENGIQRAINVIKTSCFDDEVRNFIGDGQHLTEAILSLKPEELSGHMVVLINEIESVDKIIPFISKLNSTASNWSMRDYLNSWCTHGLKDYGFLKTIHEETKYGISPLVEAYSGKRGNGNKEFKNGKFKANVMAGNKIVESYRNAVTMGLKHCNSSFLAFVRFSVDHPKLDTVGLLSKIQKDERFGKKLNREGYLALLRSTKVA